MPDESYHLSNGLFEIGSLILKYNQGEITEEEKNILDNWIDASADNQQLFATLTNHEALQTKLNQAHEIESTREEVRQRLRDLLFPGARVTPIKHSQFRNWRAIAAAVLFLAMAGAGAWFLLKKDKRDQVAVVQPTKPVVQQDIPPGGYKARLILDDGSAIVLDSANAGKLAKQGNMQVMNDNGQLVYQKEAASATKVLYNTLKTARGQMYPVKLSDGSTVWLNASSSIRFPVAFNEQDRSVEITGEAYFEIAHNDRKPFIVTVNGVTVQVVGTVFNINSYTGITTTLLKGAVKVKQGNQQVLLKPGEQANASGTGLKVQPADVEQAVAWKNGFFNFKEADLYTIMQEISRWYDIDVAYEGNVPGKKISGEIYRNSNLSEVLHVLEDLKVNFRVEGRKLIIKGR